ncbi:hypothetical protein MUN77_01685 [Leucobacter allii]|uniref:hypothetical protein n=1 Tax=Leucobacter allii TaxID=2932247 RepID=UPI001FD20B71|nr:hypothetical protein [Leucobacter allii]UOR02071.1 hypothetical protein MUN77_01685 [Leucobacter allii]
MLTEASVPGTDDWFLVEIATAMGEDFERLKLLDSYDDGTFVVPVEADPSAVEAYLRMAKKARLTFGATIVDQKVSRMNPRGFRTAAEDDVNGDREAVRLMRMNQFKSQFKKMQRWKTLYGQAFFLVGLDELNVPFLTARSPWTVGVKMNANRDWVTDAAVIIGRDDALELDLLTLVRPGYMRIATKPAKQTTIPTDGSKWTPGLDWDWSAATAVTWTDHVPVVPFTNPGRIGEFERHLDSLDRITEDILERLTITSMQAFRQRAMETGDQGLPEYYPGDHPTNPNERIDYDEIYKAGPAALWLLPKGAKIWESSPVDMSALTLAEKKDLEHLAGISGTPLYAFSQDVQGSAEGARLQRETIRAKVLDARELDGESLAQTMGILFQAYGDQARADPAEITTMWGQIEYVSKADVAPAAASAKQSGMSQRGINEHIYEMTPEELELEATNLRDEQFQNSLLGVSADGSDAGPTGPALSTETLPGGEAASGTAGPVGELQPVG